MIVDTMHTAAIRDADASGLPMTVFRAKNPETRRDDWGHASPVVMDRVLSRVKAVQVVTKAGAVRFANSTWQDERLKEFSGQFVLVDAGDVWLTYAKVLLDGWGSSYQRTFTVYPGGNDGHQS